MAYIRLGDSIEVSDSFITGHAFSNYISYLEIRDQQSTQHKLCNFDNLNKLSYEPVTVFSGYVANSFCLWLTHTSNQNRDKYVYRLPTLNEVLTSHHLRTIEDGFWCLNRRFPYLAGLTADKSEIISNSIRKYLEQSLHSQYDLLYGLCSMFNLSFRSIMADSAELIYHIPDIVDFRSFNFPSFKQFNNTGSLIYAVRLMRSNWRKSDSVSTKAQSNMPIVHDLKLNSNCIPSSLLDGTLNEIHLINERLDQLNERYDLIFNDSPQLFSEYETINSIMSVISKRFVSRSQNDPFNFEAISLLVFIVVLILAHSKYYSIMSRQSRSYLWRSSKFASANKSLAGSIRRHSLELMQALVAFAFCQIQLSFNDIRVGHIRLVREDTLL